ncbi:MAG: hypothetical protein RLZZ598_1565 [Pseudomonadota bacterium]
MLRELRGRQLELERQNEALRAVRADVEVGLARYIDLYDFAPVGYLTLGKRGRIGQINLAGAKLLGRERAQLKEMSLATLVTPEDRDPFDLWLRGVFLTGTAQSCQLRLDAADGQRRIVQLDAALAPGDRLCRVVLTDMTERRLAAQQMLDSRAALRNLLQRLQQAQEEERTRIAREIHDELGQMLTSLKMDLRWLERRLSAPSAALPDSAELLERTIEASSLNDKMIETVQALAAELRPGALDHLGLAAALAQRARQFQLRTGVACALEVHEPMALLPGFVAGELYCICQEALTNVTRHAHARQVLIGLGSSEDGVELVVEDDGIGIDPALLDAPHSLGLLGMRERALLCGGTVEVAPIVPHGTRVTVKLPLPLPSS